MMTPEQRARIRKMAEMVAMLPSEHVISLLDALDSAEEGLEMHAHLREQNHKDAIAATARADAAERERDEALALVARLLDSFQFGMVTLPRQKANEADMEFTKFEKEWKDAFDKERK